MRVVNGWIAGEKLSREAEQRLRFAFTIVRMLSERQDPRVIQAWLIAMNPELGDRAPLMLIRDGDLDIAGPEILGAAPTVLLRTDAHLRELEGQGDAADVHLPLIV